MIMWHSFICDNAVVGLYLSQRRSLFAPQHTFWLPTVLLWTFDCIDAPQFRFYYHFLKQSNSGVVRVPVMLLGQVVYLFICRWFVSLSVGCPF